ncbi:Polyketide cyclase/dehydrase/lipid transport protein [Tenacibaculum sp. 190524A02b]|uniref:SRPBCC family protein n=1 Tax=Tenacibaculum vairaonense TaxID=3137860 RepID=UPI0032B16EAE
MEEVGYKDWRVVQSVELGASAKEVWDVIGGFFTIHEWHPDITELEVLKEQTETREIRRLLTFPGQPKAIEELVMMDNENFHYRYKWHWGQWGEAIHKYYSDLRVIDLKGGTSMVQWVATFYYKEDAISEFYQRGFDELLRRFPVKTTQPV